MKKQIALVGALMLACSGANFTYAAPAPQAVSTSVGIVKGTVIDENGEPIIGASIQEVGTTRGTTSDVEGNFSINIGANAKLSFIDSVVARDLGVISPKININRVSIV